MIGTSQLINAFGGPVCFTDTTNIFGAAAAYSSNIALYQFNGNANDTTTTHNGTESGTGSPTYVTGKFGQAISFNNDYQFVNTGITPSVLGNSFSFSAWVYFTSNPGSGDYYGIAGAYAAGSGGAGAGQPQSWIFYMSDGGALTFFSNLTSGSVSFSGGTITLNQWNFIAFSVIDKNEISVYLNGNQTTQSVSNSLNGNTVALCLGNPAPYNSSRGMIGLMDQARVFDKGLSADDISTLYAETSSTTSNTNPLGEGAGVALYSMNYDASEASGYYDGTTTAVDFGVAGKINYGAKFNGSSSIMTITEGGIGASETARVPLTVSLWVKTTASNQSGIINDYGSTYAFYIQMESSSSGGAGKLSVASNYSGGFIGTAAGTAAINDGNWHHLVLVNNTSDNTQKLYIDGNTTPVISHALSTGTKTANPIAVGYYVGHVGSYNFDGSIAQIRLFQTALTTTQIGKLFAETACEYTATTTDNNYPTTNLAYYKLDNNSKDLGKSRGKFNQGATFIGSSTGIVNTTLQLSSTAHSVSLWMKPQDLTATKWQIMFLSAFNGKPTCTIGKRPDRTTSFHYRNESSQEVYFTLSTANIWYHIVVTRNNSGSTVYVNGSSVATDSNSMGSYTWAGYQKTVIGSNPLYPAEYWSGTIDQVRVYDVVLTATDVSNLYNNETVSTANTLSFPTGKTAIATYKLDGDGADISGNHSGVEGSNIKYDYSGTDTNVEYGFGRYGQAAVFNGSNSKITLSSTISGIKTYSFWINPNSSGNATYARRLFGDVGGTSYTNSITFDKPQSKVIYYEGTSARSSDTISNDTWSHIAFTSSGSTLKVYTNGSLSNTYTTSAFVSSIDEICSTTSNRQFNGLIDQVRIFNSELSSANITSLYNEKPETDTSNFKTVLYKGNSSHNYISNVGMDLETSGGLVWMKDRENSYSNTLYDSVRGTGTDKAIFSDSNVEEGDRTDIHNFVSFDANGFTLGATSHANNIINKSGYDLVAWNWKGGGLLNRSASFNGSNSKIDTGISSISSPFSVSMWINEDVLDSGVFFGNWNSTSADMYWQTTSDGKLRISIDGFSEQFFGTAGDVKINTWHHVAVALGSGSYEVYLDGNSLGTSTTSVTTFSSGQNFMIGNSSKPSTPLPFDGLIDQVRIFNKKISSSEVTSLYNEPSSTINTLQVLGDTSCVTAYPLGAGAGDLSNTYSGTPTNVTFNNPGHLTRNTSGTIESTVSANQDAGFSIVKYTGNNTDGATVGTGLTQACDIVIVKDLTSANYWCVGGSTVGDGENLYLNDTGAKLTRDRVKSVQTNTFTLGNHFETNSTNNFIAYCWHSVAGYSKMGTYTGASVPNTITTGFKPSFLLIKANRANNSWILIDSARDTDIDNNNYLRPNLNNAEVGASNTTIDIDLVDTGFILQNNYESVNYTTSTTDYLYIAFK